MGRKIYKATKVIYISNFGNSNKMTEIPIILKLKKQMQKNIALAQDIIVKELFSVFDDAVLHGGTAIWRCYSGDRFSEDIDVYIPKDEKRLEVFFKTLESKGFVIEKKKINENGLYSSLIFNRTIVRFEAFFKKIKGSLKEYENCKGNFSTINTLAPEELIKEKVQAYQNRFKIRDLYDIFFLLRHVKDKRIVREDLRILINNFKKPIDESNLKIILLESITPSSNDLLNYIKREV